MRPIRLFLILVVCVSCTAGHAERRNAILFVGDGMGVAMTTAARIYSANARDGKLTLDTFEHIALVRTYSASTMVTDSAAAGTALGSGHKTNTLMVGQLPDGTPVESILQRAKSAGMSVGIVTTTTVSHGTPASFYAHSSNRFNQPPLVDQLVEYGEIDVIMGGGRKFFVPRGTKDPETGEPSGRRDEHNRLEEMLAKGYRYLERTADLEAVREDLAAGRGAGKVLGLFSADDMAYELDRPEDTWGEPSLEEMTRLAVALLSRNPKGYFLLVEGGRIDHAAHENKARHVVNETLAFDRAVEAGLELTQAGNDTLIVVTADHETGGLSINGYPSVEIGGDDLFREPAGIGGPHIVTFATGPGANREQQEGIATDAAEYRQPALVPATSAAHSGSDVIAYAAGPSAEEFRGTIDNTDIAKKLMAFLGLD